MKDAVSFIGKAVEKRPKDGEFHCYFAFALLANDDNRAFAEMEEGLKLTYKSREIRNMLEEADKFARIYGESRELDILRSKLKSWTYPKQET